MEKHSKSIEREKKFKIRIIGAEKLEKILYEQDLDKKQIEKIINDLKK